MLQDNSNPPYNRHEREFENLLVLQKLSYLWSYFRKILEQPSTAKQIIWGAEAGGARTRAQHQQVAMPESRLSWQSMPVTRRVFAGPGSTQRLVETSEQCCWIAFVDYCGLSMQAMHRVLEVHLPNSALVYSEHTWNGRRNHAIVLAAGSRGLWKCSVNLRWNKMLWKGTYCSKDFIFYFGVPQSDMWKRQRWRCRICSLHFRSFSRFRNIYFFYSQGQFQSWPRFYLLPISSNLHHSSLTLQQ